MDNYIVKICQSGKGGFYFYKNDMLHREAGPAVLKNMTKDEFDQLDDKELYQKEITNTLLPPGYQANFLFEKPLAYDNSGYGGSIVDAIYYLDGEPFLEEEFKRNISKIKLKDELSQELSISKELTQKAKI
jgi:hypothetical protein